MRDDVIRPGDLVMVVEQTKYCGASQAIGKIFTVTHYETGSTCSKCGFVYFGHCIGLNGVYSEREHRLIKISPPAIDESTESRDEMPA